MAVRHPGNSLTLGQGYNGQEVLGIHFPYKTSSVCVPNYSCTRVRQRMEQGLKSHSPWGQWQH